ncbi:hypothetical protein ACFPVT_06325 [Corynebacterium choanae]|uniref:Secreted protein n=1 Tax=Corynebacterium choanae TaxID=1862358 RepID=A0A3G6J6G0_9CORY|nr:hypothetical protein [Corynebacterium choanae]AZA13691.1 hypothetical protein CCHOA_06460 [Corynebacterium choanae]
MQHISPIRPISMLVATSLFATAMSAAPLAAVAEPAETPTVHLTNQTSTADVVAELERTLTKARETIAELRPKAEQQRAKWGYNASFEAVNRLDDAELAIDSLKLKLATITGEDPAADAAAARDAFKLAANLQRHLDDAQYDIELGERINKEKDDNGLHCANAIDNGDTTGSSIGSSTTGIFNPIGNRIVYNTNGQPTCTTNFEYFMGKFTKFMSLVGTFAAIVAGLQKLMAPQDPAAEDAAKNQPDGDAADK